MGRVTGSWERPIQGVSQQADKDRIDGQCTLQENFIPSPLNGLIKRTGTRFVKKLMASVSDDALWYSYNRGDVESYIVLVEPASYPRVFDIGGNERVVKVDASVSANYCKSSNPKRDMRVSTIADYSFLLNTTKVVTKTADKTPVNPNTAILYCQYATYGRDYIVNLDGVEVARFTTPDGSTSAHINQVKTDYVAAQLAADITGKRIHNEQLTVTKHTSTSSSGSDHGSTTTTWYTVTTTNELSRLLTLTKLDGSDVGISSTRDNVMTITGVADGEQLYARYYTSTGVSSPYQIVQNANCLFITRRDNKEFTIKTSDSSNGNDLVAVQDSVRQLTNLPPYAPSNYVVKVQNREGYEASAYWLKAVPSNGNDQSGSSVKWEEATEQGSVYKLNKSTMPHTLISEADGTFTLSAGSWEDRRVGNEETNPFPSFVDKKVMSIGSFQNRMLFTSGEAAVFSRTNNFFDFFRETTQTEADSDPIDAYADANEINNLLHHAVLDGDIIFFAENGQFLIKGDAPLTKSKLVFKKVTSYPMNTAAEPAVTGESVMFSFVAGKYAGVREMFTDSFTDTKRARPISEHVSEYIEGVPVDLVTSPNINTLLIRTDVSKNVVYVYDWLWAGDQKVQAAFHKWIIGGDIYFAKFIRDKSILVIKRPDGVYLEDLPLSNNADDDGLTFPVNLDQRALVTASWNNQRWEWTMPYTADINKLVAVRGSGCWDADKGTSVIIETDGTTYWSYDDLADITVNTKCNLTVGTPYNSKYVPTQPYLKDGNGRAMGLDRFTLGSVTMNYESIGDTIIYVRDKASRRQWKYEYNGRMFGAWNNRVGFAPIDFGSFKFPIRLQSSEATIEINTEDYRPFILRDMEWEGMFKQRGRRL
ncbi:tail protein [Vibrio phage D530]